MNNYEITLGQTYYNNAIFNLGVDASLHIGNHGEQIRIILGDQGEIITLINRTSNANDSVRLHLGNEWLEFLHNNYNLGDILTFQVINANLIQII